MLQTKFAEKAADLFLFEIVDAVDSREWKPGSTISSSSEPTAKVS